MVSVLFLVCVLAGCGARLQMAGDGLLRAGRYDQGIELCRAELVNHPHSPAANYYMGRFLLVSGRAGEAAGHLARAVQAAPEAADYRFWLGVARGECGDQDAERKAYLAVLRQAPEHLMARLHLAHLDLRTDGFEAALDGYSRVLELRPDHPQALYNRALALGGLGRTPEEITAWRLYLAAWPQGPMSRLAADHLNALGDFGIRNHFLGRRVVTLAQPVFEPLGGDLAADRDASLDLVGGVLERSPGLVLHVVAYQLNDAALARSRALAVKDYLTRRFRLPLDRVRASWFAVSEVVRSGAGAVDVPEAVNFLGVPQVRN